MLARIFQRLHDASSDPGGLGQLLRLNLNQNPKDPFAPRRGHETPRVFNSGKPRLDAHTPRGQQGHDRRGVLF